MPVLEKFVPLLEKIPANRTRFSPAGPIARMAALGYLFCRNETVVVVECVGKIHIKGILKGGTYDEM